MDAFSTPSDPLIGQTLDGRYLVRGVLGRGGMGIVYEGVHQQLDRAVAIKVLMEGVATDPILVERFLREGRIASSLGHGNIVDVSDVGKLADGRPYLVMPKIRGVDLTVLLDRDGPMSSRRVARLLRGVASALDLVHAKGLLHRDVKPENLMYVRREDGSENVLLMDFGIATLLSSDAARLTSQGMLCGTPAYLAPERARGEDSDQRGDVYSLATVAFELMTGRLPFESENPLRILPMKAMKEPPRLGEVTGRVFPDDVEFVIAKGLARNPENRYFTAGEFLDALDEAVPDFSVPPPDGDSPAVANPTSLKPMVRTSTPPMPIAITVIVPELQDEPATNERDQASEPSVSAATHSALTDLSDATTQQALREDRDVTLSIQASASSARRWMVGLSIAFLAAAALLIFWPRAAISPSIVATPLAEPAPVVAGLLEIPPDEAAPTPQPVTQLTQPLAAPTAALPALRKPKTSIARVRSDVAPREKDIVAARPAALAFEPTQSVEALNKEASQALMQGHLGKAADLYAQATKRDGRSAAAWRGLGVASERLGRRAAAITAFENALRLEPRGAHASSIEGRLQKLQAAP